MMGLKVLPGITGGDGGDISVICVTVSFVSWCHFSHDVKCVTLSFVSQCHLCHCVICVTVRPQRD